MSGPAGAVADRVNSFVQLMDVDDDAVELASHSINGMTLRGWSQYSNRGPQNSARAPTLCPSADAFKSSANPAAETTMYLP